jgi:hypothetical protein
VGFGEPVVIRTSRPVRMSAIDCCGTSKFT